MFFCYNRFTDTAPKERGLFSCCVRSDDQKSGEGDNDARHAHVRHGEGDTLDRGIDRSVLSAGEAHGLGLRNTVRTGQYHGSGLGVSGSVILRTGRGDLHGDGLAGSNSVAAADRTTVNLDSGGQGDAVGGVGGGGDSGHSVGSIIQLVGNIHKQNIDFTGGVLHDHVLDIGAGSDFLSQSDGAALDALGVGRVNIDDHRLVIILELQITLGGQLEVVALVIADNGILIGDRRHTGDLAGGGGGGVGDECALGVLGVGGIRGGEAARNVGQLNFLGAVPNGELDNAVIAVLGEVAGAGDVAVSGVNAGAADGGGVGQVGHDNGGHTVDALGDVAVGARTPAGHGLQGSAGDDLGLGLAGNGAGQIDDSVVSDQVAIQLGGGIAAALDIVDRGLGLNRGVQRLVSRVEDIVGATNSSIRRSFLDSLQLIHVVTVDLVGVQAGSGNELNITGSAGSSGFDINAHGVDGLGGTIGQQDAGLVAGVLAELRSDHGVGAVLGSNNVKDIVNRGAVDLLHREDVAVDGSVLDLVIDGSGVEEGVGAGAVLVPGAVDLNVSGALDGAGLAGGQLDLGNGHFVLGGVSSGSHENVVVLGHAGVVVDVLEVISGGSTALSLNGNTLAAHEGDLAEGEGSGHGDFDLAVVVHIVQVIQIGLVLAGQSANIAAGSVNADGALGLVILLVDGDLVGADGDVSALGGDDLLSIGGNAVDNDIIVDDLVDDLGLHAHERGVVHGGAEVSHLVAGSDGGGAGNAAGNGVGVLGLVAVIGDVGDVTVLGHSAKGLSQQSLRRSRSAGIIANGDVASSQIDRITLLDDGGLNSVVDHLSGLVTGEHLGAGDRELVKELAHLSVADNVDRPVVADIALNISVVADGDEQHLGSLNGGDVGVGSEGAVATTGDDALAVAILDVAFRPVTVDVLEVGGGALEGSRVDVAEHDDGDHLRHLRTGDVAGGSEAAVGHTIDDAQSIQDVDSFIVADLVSVGESCVADGDEDMDMTSASTRASNFFI